MARVSAMCVGITLFVSAPGWIAAAAASGGGACPPPITTSSTSTVDIEDYCFGPTVAYARVGDRVAWVNRDPVGHTVTGANRAWGRYRELRRGNRVAYRFEEPGVFPYYCVLHPGMVGAVVIGDGRPPLAGGDAPDGVALVRARPTQAATSGLPLPAILALAMGAAAALWYLRPSRKSGRA